MPSYQSPVAAVLLCNIVSSYVTQEAALVRAVYYSPNGEGPRIDHI